VTQLKDEGVATPLAQVKRQVARRIVGEIEALKKR
jgi:hypothetical protein